MLAMVLRWFICDIAMATDAGGSPMGSRGWGIIMKGRSNPKRKRRADQLFDMNRTGVPQCILVLVVFLSSVASFT